MLYPFSTAPYSHSKINPPDTRLWSCYTLPVRILGRAQTLSSVTAKALYDPGSTHPPYYSSNIPLTPSISSQDLLLTTFPAVTPLGTKYP